MSEHLHPGLHPDPDSLSAFIEGVLPEHERLQCMAHLAECSRCREVVFLAQEPPPVPAAANPAPASQRWFAPVPVLAAAAVACVAVVAVALYLHNKAAAPHWDMVASVKPAPRGPAAWRPPVTPKSQPRTSPAPGSASTAPANRSEFPRCFTSNRDRACRRQHSLRDDGAPKPSAAACNPSQRPV